ncbi:hypothetical protein COB21_05875 [Candidatus Aerophobetes bacterium]|uniref:BPL/LPL catalytic domain-containing protein n=1 Tax=Aerophobetes bacterium TaxID=2030807 RepID=A0A2A4WYF6_UNCAE|nr:MAG: hypothetical protein COB21_05875 [Candidatus Aerophobetes bacterium]
MTDWDVLNGADKEACLNMQIDKKLLSEVGKRGKPVIHIHRWKAPSATYGYFFPLAKHVKEEARGEGSATVLARRPTGGGMVFHAFDISFAVVLPLNFPGISDVTVDNYKWINCAALRAVEKFLSTINPEKSNPLLSLLEKESPKKKEEIGGFCMAKPTVYDVVLENGQKIVGAAQRRTKEGLLHQGTVALTLPSKNMICATLVQGDQVYAAMEKTTFAVMDEAGVTGENFHSCREQLIEYLIEEIKALRKHE